MIKINLKKIARYLFESLFFIALSFLVKNSALFCINNNINISNKVFGLLFVKNKGAAFSLFSSHTDLLILLSWAVLTVILFYVVKNSYRLSNLKVNSLAVLTAGISGNLFERIHDGFVTDYINLNFVNFPVFNASDVLITIGAILLIIALYKNK